MTKVDILLGLQWGDEGKGKIVDFLAPHYDVVARFQGGPNAGHTLEFNGIKHVLHQIPSGIFHPQILNIIGNGVVLDPITFQKEIEGLKPFNLNVKDTLIISNKAQMILPTHKLLDKAYEEEKGEAKIGSTLRGIGPTYQDKIGRLGIRIGDILRPDFQARYQALKEHHLEILKNHDLDTDIQEAEAHFFEAIDELKEFPILNTEYVINAQIQKGKKVLAEGAQGSLLDVDFGSYPFVTSSNTTAAGACTGLGISPSSIGRVYGIFKAYCTRVGSGPFPTELLNEEGEDLRKRGHEFGATTGRPRRCGWLDLPALQYACMLNGVTDLFMMKADVLSGLNQIKVCEAYNTDHGPVAEIPYYYEGDTITPEYKEVHGWQNFDSVNNFSELPEAIKHFNEIIESHSGAPVRLVSYGPDRNQTIFENILA